ncbi:hypothetical protein E2542_SST10259 [Spatholobus suberectus]|nr:hypothetical protein E2542_SST10259 [Spatholobus suberectus]
MRKEARLSQPAAEPESTISRNQSGNVSFRENSSSIEGPEFSKLDKKSCEPNGNVKRKQVEVIREAQYPNKSHKSDQGIVK